MDSFRARYLEQPSCEVSRNVSSNHMTLYLWCTYCLHVGIAQNIVSTSGETLHVVCIFDILSSITVTIFCHIL